jgi:predicted CopG family antitoxin
MSKRHTLTINHEAFVKLKSRGMFEESYSDLISRLTDNNQITIANEGEKD